MPAAVTFPADEVNRASAARSAMWSVVENGGMAVISFVSLIVYARFLAVSDFGLFSIMLAIVETMLLVVTMLCHDALVQRPDINELHYDTAFSASLVLSALLMGVCWLIAPLLSQRTGSSDAAAVLRWMSLSLPLGAVSATIAARRRRGLEFRALALRSLIGRSVGALAGIVLVLLGATFWGLVAQQVLVVLFGSLVLWFSSHDRPRVRFGLTEFRELIAFSSFSVAALFVLFSTKRAFIALAGIALGTHSAGLLNLSFRVVDTFWVLAATAVSQIALPILSRLRGEDERFQRVFRTANAFTYLTLSFCFVLIASTAPEIVEILFGKEWLGAAPYVTILAMIGLIQGSRLLLSPVLTALGRPRDVLVAQVAELILVLGALLLLGAPSIGWALAIWAARECLGGVILATLLRRATGVDLRAHLATGVVPLACAAVMFGVLWECRSLLPVTWGLASRLAVLAPLGLGVYVACAFVLNRRLVVELLEFGHTAIRRPTRP